MSKKQTIWFINKDAGPLSEYGTHLRTVKQAQFFQERGYDVRLVCSGRVHNTEINHVEEGLYKEEMHDDIPYLFISSPAYGESGAKRILAYMAFARNVRKASRYFTKPDIIVHTSRIPFDYAIYRFARRIKAKYILDVTDLWPMEFEHFGYLKKGNPVLNLFYAVERHLYAKADHTVMSMEGCHDYIKEKKWDRAQGGPVDLDKVHYVNNGVDLKEYHQNLETYSLDDPDLLDPDTFKFIYLGSIRKANHLDSLIDAARYLKDYPQIKILLYGNGDERPHLEKRCAAEGIDNVLFKAEWTEPQFVPFLLGHASVNLLNYAPDWAPYGGSMNKMFMALAAGKPILCNVGMKYSPIRDADLGIDERLATPQAYADAMVRLYRMSGQEREAIRLRAQEVVKQYDTDALDHLYARYCDIPSLNGKQ